MQEALPHCKISLSLPTGTYSVDFEALQRNFSHPLKKKKKKKKKRGKTCTFEEFSTSTMIHYKIQVILCLKGVIQRHNKGMIGSGKNFSLRQRPFDLFVVSLESRFRKKKKKKPFSHLISLHHLAFVNLLHRIVLPRANMLHKIDIANIAFAQPRNFLEILARDSMFQEFDRQGMGLFVFLDIHFGSAFLLFPIFPSFRPLMFFSSFRPLMVSWRRTMRTSAPTCSYEVQKRGGKGWR